ncbi:MAG: leucyl aminopeptidase [Actinomycetota bacterium]|nr:leucyl aminopeptidase [Actinomycetota bacterium]
MQINIKDTDEIKTQGDVLILPLFESTEAGPFGDINEALGGLPLDLIKKGDFKAQHKETMLLFTYGKIAASAVLLAGLGPRDKSTPETIRQAGGAAASYLKNTRLANAALSTRTFDGQEASPADFIQGMLLAHYRFGAYKKEEDKKGLESLAVLSKKEKELAAPVKKAEIIADAVGFTRNLINTPANDMTPTALAEAARSIGSGVSVQVIEKNEAIKLGMGAFIAVSKGSMEPPKFIILEYKGGVDKKPVVLIGKSITFDSGGISIKPSEGMEKMKYDMAGGGAVLGVFKAISGMKLPLHVIGILPATENLPGGTATRPGDIAKTIGGKTIEIINTDAEGRLVLADALGYAKKYEPAAVIDIATLTGACDIALGGEAVALMGNDENLIARIQDASGKTGERTWHMPLFDEYKDYIKSDVADLKNSGGRSGSLVTAGYFLKEFANGLSWAHLDIASTAWTDKDRPYSPKGATGIGVRLLIEFLAAGVK